MAVQTQTPRLIAGGSRISRSPTWALCTLASRTGPDELGFRPSRPSSREHEDCGVLDRARRRSRRLSVSSTTSHSSPRFPDTASAVITRLARAFVQELTDALDDDPIRRPLSYYSIGRIISILAARRCGTPNALLALRQSWQGRNHMSHHGPWPTHAT